MTQKDKLKKATMMALMVRSAAKNMRCEAQDYDNKWPLHYADGLEQLANEFLNLK